jgi:hypothetical protein
MKLSPGDTVDLLNISRSGVLVEGRTRFVPGTRITGSLRLAVSLPPGSRAR